MAIIKVEDIAHVRFAAPDLSLMRGFLEDFGSTARAATGGLSSMSHSRARPSSSLSACAPRALPISSGSPRMRGWPPNP